LTAGAVAAAKDTAEKGVKDTYKGLKTFNYQQRRQWLSGKNFDTIVIVMHRKRNRKMEK
jgi:hypothetical protein